jgi:hypothetical protein
LCGCRGARRSERRTGPNAEARELATLLRDGLQAWAGVERARSDTERHKSDNDVVRYNRGVEFRERELEARERADQRRHATIRYLAWFALTPIVLFIGAAGVLILRGDTEAAAYILSAIGTAGISLASVGVGVWLRRPPPAAATPPIERPS